MVCCTRSVTSPSYFSSNFIKGWDTLANILYSSKMGEIALTISKGGLLPNLDEITARQVFKVTVNELVAVIELGPFLGALGPIVTQNWALSQVLGIQAWQPTNVFLVEFYSKIRHFCKI